MVRRACSWCWPVLGTRVAQPPHPGRATRQFTDKFEDIGDRRGVDEDQAPSNTADKLAVFYADGNGFGATFQKKLEVGLGEYKIWSDELQRHHQAILRKLLDVAKADPAWQNDGNIRLVTLLWGRGRDHLGGAAWKGWEDGCRVSRRGWRLHRSCFARVATPSPSRIASNCT